MVFYSLVFLLYHFKFGFVERSIFSDLSLNLTFFVVGFECVGVIELFLFVDIFPDFKLIQILCMAGNH